MQRSGKRVYDAIVFPGTGDTGSAAVRLLYHYADRFNIKSWAVSARNLEKLEKNVLSPLVDAGGKGVQWSGDPIKADLAEFESLLALCKKTKVVLACAGPYAKYGEKVIAPVFSQGRIMST